MHLLTTVADLRQYRHTLSGGVALVPTMGALHAGHLAHLGAARGEAQHVVVSIFVNPTQFGPSEDFARYPRTLDVDLAKCETAGASAVFAPGNEDMYPPGVPAVELNVPAVAAELEGAVRPGHFAGVCRVVLKLLNLVRPDVVTFGRKDYQQLCVVRAMIEDLMLDTRLLEVPTYREGDGLAMSSRNRHLDDTTRKHGLGLSKALRQAAHMAEAGEGDPRVIENAMRETMRAHHVEVDYAEVRHARTLGVVDQVLLHETVALVAGRVGEAGTPPEGGRGSRVRLIDNVVLGEGF